MPRGLGGTEGHCLEVNHMKPIAWQRGLSRIGWEVTPLLARIFPGIIFWQSGQTKVEGWNLTESAVFLFHEEYRLPLLDPHLAAVMAATAEHVLPLLILLGLATRFAASGLLVMTMVIQCLVYPDAWPTHGTWALGLLILITQGGGRWSLDHWIWLRSQSGSRASSNPCVEHADVEQCLGGPK